MNALEIAISGLVNEKHFITTEHLDDHAYQYRNRKVIAYEKRVTVIDREIERLLTLDFYPSTEKQAKNREEFLKEITK